MYILTCSKIISKYRVNLSFSPWNNPAKILNTVYWLNGYSENGVQKCRGETYPVWVLITLTSQHHKMHSSRPVTSSPGPSCRMLQIHLYLQIHNICQSYDFVNLNYIKVDWPFIVDLPQHCIIKTKHPTSSSIRGTENRWTCRDRDHPMQDSR